MNDNNDDIKKRKLKFKITPDEVIRELRNMKRRKGGMQRAHYEMIADVAWYMAWQDNFQSTPVEYMQMAEDYERERMDKMVERFRAGYQKHLDNKRKHLSVIDGGVK
jgi:hypothetical protein